MSDDRVTLRFDSFRAFLEQCSERISEEGIFLATDAIRPVGSTVEFDLGIDSEFPLLRGSGEVVWVVEPDGEETTPGMAVRYAQTDDATATLARKIAARCRAETGAVFDLSQAAIPAPVVATEEIETPVVVEEVPDEAADEALTVPDEVEAEIEATVGHGAPALAAEAAESVAEPAPAVVSEARIQEISRAAEASSGGGRRGTWAVLALVAVLAGVAYWQRDLLRGWMGGSSDRAAAPVERPLPRATEPEPLEPAEPMVQEASEVEAVEPEEAAPAEPTPAGPLTRIEEIRWETTGDGTLLQLLADGTFARGSYRIERLEDPPRLLLRISGVTAPLATPTLAVGSEEVVGVRTALHGTAPSTSLHVVVDLADPTAQAADAEVVGATLQLRISSAAISP